MQAAESFHIFPSTSGNRQNHSSERNYIFIIKITQKNIAIKVVKQPNNMITPCIDRPS